MTRRNAALASFAIALIAGFGIAGRLFYKAPIGLDSSAFLFGDTIFGWIGGQQGAVVAIVWVVVTLIAIAVTSFFLMRAAQRRVDPSRRGFLASGGVAVGTFFVGAFAAAARAFLGWGEAPRGWADVNSQIQADVVKTHPEWMPGWKGSRVQKYRRLGRTDWNVSDIVLGTGRITAAENGVEIARLAIERGVNYFDTSPDYSGAGSEQAMGEAMKTVQRDQMFIATKFCTPHGHLPPGTPVEKYVENVESSLKRLGTDYVDLCHVHSVDSVDRLMDPNAHEAFDRLKQAGKVRFMGFSTHTPNLIEVANAGVDSGRFDVMMLAYHHGMWSPLDAIIERGVKEHDMGVVAMKTLKGAKHHGLAGFRDEADAYSQAALRWTLSNPNVSCAVISFFELQHVDEYLHASGGGVTATDLAILKKYDQQILGSYCAPHCGACLSTCPEELAIHDVLRHRMYFEDYGWEKEGMRLYGKLDKNASVCASCSAPCLGSCPTGIPIQERMVGAHELLTIG